MSHSVRINVTQEDIDMGLPCNAKSCPIALAALRCGQEQLERVDGISATQYGIYYTAGVEHRISWQGTIVPTRAKRFIEAFDSGKPVYPFSFTLSVLDMSA